MISLHNSGISETEFLNRLTRLKKFIVSHDLAALLVFSTARSHIWYQTGHVGYISNWSNRDRVSDTMVVILGEGDPVLLISGLPYMIEQVRELSWMSDVRVVAAKDPCAAALPSLSSNFGTEIQAILSERGLKGKKVGLIGVEAMPVPVYESLVEALSASAIELVDDVVAELRSCKSPAEIFLMREAARLSDLGFRALLESAKPGMFGYEIIAEMERAVRAQGADYVQFWMTSSPSDGSSISLPDIKPHRRRLGRGDQITCCSYVVYKGYWAHAMRTGTLAGSSPQQERIFPPCLKIHRRAIEAMKPGVPVSEIAKLVHSAAQKAGMELHSPRIGHGIGLDYSERPFLSESNTELLKEGMVVEIHPQFIIPGEGSFYVPLGDVCYLSKDGVEILTRFPQDSFLVK